MVLPSIVQKTRRKLAAGGRRPTSPERRLAAAGAAGAAGPLGVSVPGQLQTQWCWAAVAVGLKKFLDNVTMTQCDVANLVLGETGCCSDGSHCNEPQALEDVLMNTHNFNDRQDGEMQFSIIRAQIVGGLPVCVGIRKNNGDGHFMVIDGCSTAGAVKLLSVRDPAGQSGIWTLADVSTFRNQGTWEFSYKTRKSA